MAGRGRAGPPLPRPGVGRGVGGDHQGPALRGEAPHRLPQQGEALVGPHAADEGHHRAVAGVRAARPAVVAGVRDEGAAVHRAQPRVGDRARAVPGHVAHPQQPGDVPRAPEQLAREGPRRQPGRPDLDVGVVDVDHQRHPVPAREPPGQTQAARQRLDRQQQVRAVLHEVGQLLLAQHRAPLAVVGAAQRRPHAVAPHRHRAGAVAELLQRHRQRVGPRHGAVADVVDDDRHSQGHGSSKTPPPARCGALRTVAPGPAGCPSPDAPDPGGSPDVVHGRRAHRQSRPLTRRTRPPPSW
ncbi:MAG: hypothetical protein AVDCRST_MAG35-2920 [uncultured Quadrisphaera sp.]|uniref:Uncharacterized protein n=1 Tax=uncultured Quadrisphaera sp. TaxID=904978 RepID=A0A6J4Q6R8_9ACTN|nr:MAG: hypothetical protein AVDCRST_MAG35-2920 [uncultured Quadrisphaera sp.]